MIADLKILKQHGKQYISDITKAEVPSPFRGLPVISEEKIDEDELVELCPVNAITGNPVSINLGKCTFCGECAFAFPDKIIFTNDHRIATNDHDKLTVSEGQHVICHNLTH